MFSCQNGCSDFYPRTSRLCLSDVAQVLIASYSLQPIDTAFINFEKFLHNEIAAKKAELARDMKLDGQVSAANKNVFGRFVAASEREGSQGLGMSELIGNLFIFMFAGVSRTILFFR